MELGGRELVYIHRLYKTKNMGTFQEKRNRSKCVSYSIVYNNEKLETNEVCINRLNYRLVTQ